MSIRKVLLSLGVLLVFGLSALGAWGNQLSYSFSGVLTSSYGSLSAGDAFSGTYTIDSSIAARAGSTSSFAVFDDLVSATLVIGSFTATIGPGLGLSELQQDDVPGADRYALVGRNAVGSTQIGGLDLSLFAFALFDPTGTAVNDALTLLLSPNLANFASNIFFLGFQDSTVEVEGILTTFSAAPEPSTLLLLAASMLFGGYSLRRRS
jgi:hypothetical protein